MKQAFVEIKFRTETLGIIALANVILAEYEAQGFKLSLRQLYYQLIARDLLPDTWIDPQAGTKNNFKNYKRLGSIISDGRQAGLIDWDLIEDRGRETVRNSHWTSVGDIIQSAASGFQIDKWRDQDVHVEVMVEKDALSGVLEPVCRELDIAITANKGYSSSSTMYEIGRRLFDKHEYDDKEIVVIYLGDHDPSGIDMTRDVEDRLQLYSEVSLNVVRLALNYDQVLLWKPPENPAKESDARFVDYQRKFGDSCWELDAIEPAQLADLVRQEVYKVRDTDLWDSAVEEEAEMIAKLKKLAVENR